MRQMSRGGLLPSSARRRLYQSWALPYRQEPWALPFQVSQQTACSAFQRFHESNSRGTRVTLQAVRPYMLPFYVFEGTLHVNFTGVVGYKAGDESDAYGKWQASEFKHHNIDCPPIDLGADTGSVSAVYAGFGFRRLFVRQALAGGLTEELLQQSVPLTHIPAAGKPVGIDVQPFEMKPSFAFVQRLQERLPEVAHHAAECRMRTAEVRSLSYAHSEAPSCDEPGEGGAKLVRPMSIQPDYDRVDQVQFDLQAARLHARGIVVLPVWAIEYVCLGQSYRAFVSALAPTGGGSRLATVACLRHGGPLLVLEDDANWGAGFVSAVGRLVGAVQAALDDDAERRLLLYLGGQASRLRESWQWRGNVV